MNQGLLAFSGTRADAPALGQDKWEYPALALAPLGAFGERAAGGIEGEGLTLIEGTVVSPAAERRYRAWANRARSENVNLGVTYSSYHSATWAGLGNSVAAVLQDQPQ